MKALVCVNATKNFYSRELRRAKGNGNGKNGNGGEARNGKPGNRKFSFPWQYSRVKTTAVDRVSLELESGSILGILGQNGSGKSTLIRLMSTLLLPDDGVITVFGKDVVKHSMLVRRMINRVSVDAAFFKKLSAWENLAFSARLYGFDIGKAKLRAVGILDRLGLNEKKMNNSLEELSRGMQQKVAIARALLTSPMLLLLDEPTTGLDPNSKRDVQEFIKEIKDKHRISVLLTTHDMDEADRLCDRIAIIHEGKIVVNDTPFNLKAQVAAKNNRELATTTMEDVFFYYSGETWKNGGDYEDDG